MDMNWVEGDAFIVDVDPNLNLSHGINFKEVTKERLETTGCSEISFYKCFSKRHVL